jgi:hypothetical protein
MRDHCGAGTMAPAMGMQRAARATERPQRDSQTLADLHRDSAAAAWTREFGSIEAAAEVAALTAIVARRHLG